MRRAVQYDIPWENKGTVNDKSYMLRSQLQAALEDHAQSQELQMARKADSAALDALSRRTQVLTQSVHASSEACTTLTARITTTEQRLGTVERSAADVHTPDVHTPHASTPNDSQSFTVSQLRVSARQHVQGLGTPCSSCFVGGSVGEEAPIFGGAYLRSGTVGTVHTVSESAGDMTEGSTLGGHTNGMKEPVERLERVERQLASLASACETLEQAGVASGARLDAIEVRSFFVK